MKFRALFVDDDPDMHLLLRRATERCGLFSAATFVADGKEALGFLLGLPAGAQPDLVVTTCGCPSSTDSRSSRS